MSDGLAAIERWFAFLNRTLEAEEVFTEDVEVVYLALGRGGPETRLVGLSAVSAWGRRGPAGRFVFTARTEACHAEADATLPRGDGAALRVGYRVESTQESFSNEGEDTLHVRGGRICGVRHVPEPLP